MFLVTSFAPASRTPLRTLQRQAPPCQALLGQFRQSSSLAVARIIWVQDDFAQSFWLRYCKRPEPLQHIFVYQPKYCRFSLRDGMALMVGMDRRTGRAIGRPEHIAQSIKVLLTTGKGERVMANDVGVDFLDDAGHLVPGLGPVRIEESAHNALTRYEPRVDLDAVTAHFDGDELDTIRVAYRDREDGSQHEVTISYRDRETS